MNSLRDRWLTLRSDQSGLTLVELLIAMLLFSILSGVLLSSLIATRNSTQATQQQHEHHVRPHDEVKQQMCLLTCLDPHARLALAA